MARFRGKNCYTKKPSSDTIIDPSNIYTIGQLVILLDDSGKFINAWTVDNLTNIKRSQLGKLDIWKK